jgi:GAF domain-containing protein/HAMP domain-containing protein
MTETKSQPSANNTRHRISLSLRAKILLGILLIILFTVAAMGYFVFYRSRSANEFLIEQFDVSVAREIENNLNTITSREANEISTFFSTMENVTSSYGATTGAFISTEKAISLEGDTWNAYLKLSRLSNGSWDNSNDEIASIFLPQTMELNDSLAKELAALKGVDYFAQALLEENPDVIAIFFGGTSSELVYYPNIDFSAVVPPDFDPTGRPWYLNSADQQREDRKVTWSVPYLDIAHNGLVITSSIPVFDNTNSFRGVVGIDLKLASITERISNLVIGKTGYSFLIDREGRLIAMPSKGYGDFNLTEEEIQSGDVENLSLINRVPLDVFEVLAKMTSGQSGVKLVEINGINHYIAYKPIPIVGYSLGVVVAEDVLLQDFVETNTILEAETRQTLINSIGVIVILLSVAGLASYGIGNSITAPLEKLINVAEEVARGNLDVRADVTTTDEIGILGATLNSMTSTTHDLITNLESNVAERTKAVERRVNQIQAVAEVGKAVTTQRDLEELLDRTTHLISNRFGYYHVGIFLLDPRGEYAVLRSSNSSGGARMLAREHKLRVGREGIVGTAASTGEAHIALDVGEDAVYFDNPDMPDTHSEIALPLIAGEEILGVLDVQSVEKNAFSEDDIPALQILADQLATAVQNARLLRDTQEALNAAQKAYGGISERGWNTLLKKTKAPGFIGMLHGELIPTRKELDTNTKDILHRGEVVLSADKRTLNAPIVARGQTIGMMRLVKPSHAETWELDEIEDIEKLSAQISNALESARLYDEAQRRADFESLSGEIADTIRSSSGIENILQNAIRELGQKLGATRTYVQLSTDSAGDGSDKGSAK